jgi:hypothetical protein
MPDGAAVVSDQAAHHVTQFLAHDRAHPVVIPLPELTPERMLVVRNEVPRRIPAILLELVEGLGRRLLRNGTPEQQAGQAVWPPTYPESMNPMPSMSALDVNVEERVRSSIRSWGCAGR